MSDSNKIGGIHYEIMKRCYNPKSIMYPTYGAIGITVCDEWHDREVFRKWCLDNGFVKGMRVLRYDTSKGYSPENCYVDYSPMKKKNDNNRINKERAKKHRIKKNELGIKSLTKSPFYAVFNNMHIRCEKPTNERYSSYGARGISVCDEWSGKEGIYNFIEWAENNGWRPGLTLDRIDVNGNYEPSNCRWTTWEEQARNKRNTKLYPYMGTMLLATDISKIENIPESMLRYRLNKGMSVDEAIDDIRKKIS